MIYILVFILLLIPVVKYDLMAKSGGEGGWYYFNLVVLILLAGLRYRVGGDTLMYMSMYDEIPALSELKYFDFEEALYNPLWYVYNSIFRSIGDDFVYFQIGQAVFVNSVFFWFFRKYSPQYYFSAILLYYIGYYCYFNMEIMREILCVCILMLMTPWLLAKRWIPYYAGCIVAINFHYSSAVMLGIPILYYLFRKPSWKLQLIIIAGITTLMSVVNIMALIVRMIAQDERLVELVEKYTESSGNLTGMLFQLITALPVVGMTYIRYKCDVDYRDKFVSLATGAVFAYSFAMGFFAFARLANYFIPFVLVFTVHTIYYFVTNYNLRSAQVSTLVVGASVFLISFNLGFYYLRDMSTYYPNTRFKAIFSPYYSVLNPKIDEQRERFMENYRDVTIMF